MRPMRTRPTISMFLTHDDLLKAQKEWYQEYSERLEGLVKDFISEYCLRTGVDDHPQPADNQDCEVVKNAMKLLDM